MEAFSLQKVVDLLEEVVELARGQVNMVDEAKLHSPTHSTFCVTCDQVLLWRGTGPFL